jgi:hypothetical protein
MLGGINNGLFMQGLSGFIVIIIFALILRWIFDSPSTQAARIKRREDKKSLRRLKRK